MREPFVRLSVGNLDDANRSDVLVNGSLDGSSTVDLSVVEREWASFSLLPIREDLVTVRFSQNVQLTLALHQYCSDEYFVH